MDTWATATADFSRYLVTHGKSADTATTYVWHVGPFRKWCLHHEINPFDANRSACEGYVADQLQKGLSRSTVHVRLAALKAFYGWLIDLGVRADNPAEPLTIRKEQRQPRPPLSGGDARRLLAHCRNDEERLLFIIGLGCGLRLSELVGIRFADVYPERGLMLVKGKGSKERWVAPEDRVMAAIMAYRQGKTGKLFDLTREQARRIMNRVAKNASVTGFYPHRMRITFASRFLDKTHDLHSLQVLMGHASPDVTARYAAFDAQQRALDQMRKLTSAG